MSKNIENFATLMSKRMQATSGAMIPRTLELGRIGDNMSLIPDNFMAPIPKGDYMVDLRLTGGLGTSIEEHTHGGGDHAQEGGPGTHTHSGGSHQHMIPNSLRGLEPGDRVLIAWCGNEAVVIAIVVSS